MTLPRLVLWVSTFVIWGGMFTFPSLMLASDRAQGDRRDILVGGSTAQRLTAPTPGEIL